jgi:hypothetical protein
MTNPNLSVKIFILVHMIASKQECLHGEEVLDPEQENPKTESQKAYF